MLPVPTLPFHSTMTQRHRTLLLLLLAIPLGGASPPPPPPLPPQFSTTSPIWSPHNGSQFVQFRSPYFAVPSSATNTTLFITARQTPLDYPGTGVGNLQGKLLGAYRLWINGVMVTVGPGRNVPDTAQSVDAVDVSGLLLLGPTTNLIAVQSFFANDTNAPGVHPLLMVLVVAHTPKGADVIAMETSTAWTTHDADAYFNPTRPDYTSWYRAPNEFLDTRVAQTGWFAPTGPPLRPGWLPAALAPALTTPFAVKDAPPPAVLTRRACAVVPIPAGADTHYVVDFGQEFSGGPVLTLPGGPNLAGVQLEVRLGEAVASDGSVVYPCMSGEAYRAVWTLSADAASNANVTYHEFIQFRYAEFRGSPVPITLDMVHAWVLQFPAGGSGINPWELPCAASTPVLPVRSADLSRRLGSVTSSSAELEAVWNFTAYSIVSTSLDIDVDSQTRQRDLCHIDALITSLGQYCILDDTATQRRTAFAAFQYDSGIWPSSADFKMSTTLLGWLDLLEGGSSALVRAKYGRDNDTNLTLQFYSMIRYYNGTGNSLLHFPSNCNGSWACNALVDWPPVYRDGFVFTDEDAVRNGLGAYAIRALARIAAYIGHDDDAARYMNVSDTISAAMVKHLLVHNGSTGESYFLDGTATSHDTLHATVYGIIGGTLDPRYAPGGDIVSLSIQLTAYLRRRGMAAGSCMTSRYLLEALYQLGVWNADAADYAMELMTGAEYPGWRYMMALGASITLEAWRPSDKDNNDYAHPWCSAPAFIIPRFSVGLQPLEPGWRRMRIAPQPSNITMLVLRAPTVAGEINVTVRQREQEMIVDVTFNVPEGVSAQVCLALPSFPAAAAANASAATASRLQSQLDAALAWEDGPVAARSAATAPHDVAADATLYVDGRAVDVAPWGRFLCTVSDVTASGSHSASLEPSMV